MESKNIGKVVQIVGAVVDIHFEKDSLPDLLNAIEIDNKGEKLVVEVAQHIGDDIVRCIAMGSTDGLMRGIDAVDTGKAISVPVGKETLSRMFNLLGEPVDNLPAPETKGDTQRTADIRRAVCFKRDSGNRYQGHRPYRTISERRKDRSFRRCRSRQDGAYSGAYK